VGLAGAILLAAACYVTAYRPVLGCQAQLRMAEHEPERAVEHLDAAAAADRYSPEPWQRLAAIELWEWLRAPSRDSFDRFEAAIANANRLAPNSASAWLGSGDAYWQAASQLDYRDYRRKSFRPILLSKAVEAYRQAVLLYPNSAQYRAKLAEALLAQGNTDDFPREAETALRLDRETPHLDKKLPDDVRSRLLRGLGGDKK
jgi:cytochrome c-type biogenesis protein CcmH/NrfG